MKLLFIADPLDSFKVEKDTTLAMMRAAKVRGTTYGTHKVMICYGGKAKPGRGLSP